MAEMTTGDTFYFSLLFQSFISGPLFWPYISGSLFQPLISASYFIHRPRKRRSRKMVPRKQSSMHMAVQTPWRPSEGAKAAASVRRTAQMLNTFMIHGTTVLAAPTGRAAKRMEESTERAAVTLHRLLGYRGGSEGDSLKPEKNEDDPLECDAIIIDEASMIDIYLMGNLMKAVQDNTRLVFVGDIDQLPSVGPGNVLQDLIQSEIIPTVKLDKIYRQSAESLIVTNAHRINHGEEPILNQPEKDFFFLPTANAIDALDVVIDLVIRRLPTHYGLRAKSDIQVLSAMKKGPCGVENLNQSLQQALNPKQTNRAEIEVRDQIFREGDSVMQTRNNYKMTWKERPSMKFSLLHGEDEEAEGEGVYNGDFGLIERIDPEGEWLEVDFEGRLARYTSEEFKDLIHSYAITIHKSQGSEFPCVVIPLVAGPPMLLTRNILYTAITRAKKLVVLVGSQNMLSSLIRNSFASEVFTSPIFFPLKSSLSAFLRPEVRPFYRVFS